MSCDKNSYFIIFPFSGLFTKSMLLIFQALALYSTSTLKILKIIAPVPPPTKTLLFSLSNKSGLRK